MTFTPEMYRLLSKHAHLAHEVLHPFGEKAAFLGSSSKENGEWLEKFRGTELHAQAINLAQKQLQLSMQEEQQDQQQEAAREQVRQQFRDPEKMLRQQKDQIELQKEQLNLQLEELVNQGNVDSMSPALSPGLSEEDRAQAAGEGAELAEQMVEGEKAAAPLGILPRLKAFGGAALEHGLAPGVSKQVTTSLKDMAVPGALLGAAAGALNPDEQKGESRLHSALMGGLSGGALGAATAGLGGLSHLKGKFDANTAKGMTPGHAASRAAGSLLSSEGQAAHRMNLRAERTALPGGTPSTPHSSAPTPPAGAPPAIPDLEVPTRSAAPAAAPSPTPAAPAPQAAPPLSVPTRSPGPGLGKTQFVPPTEPPMVSTAPTPSPKAPPTPLSGQHQLDFGAMANLAQQHGLTPMQKAQLLDPGTPIKGGPILPAGTTGSTPTKAPLPGNQPKVLPFSNTHINNEIQQQGMAAGLPASGIAQLQL